MAKLTTDEIIDALKEMTLLEASELVKAIEDTFGVSAAAPASASRPEDPLRLPCRCSCRCCRRSRCWRC